MTHRCVCVGGGRLAGGKERNSSQVHVFLSSGCSLLLRCECRKSQVPCLNRDGALPRLFLRKGVCSGVLWLIQFGC